MLLTSHLASALIVGKLINLSGPIEWIVALTATLAIDLDHVFVNLKYISDFKTFFKRVVERKGRIFNHTWIQELVFGMIVGVIIGFLISLLFNIFWWIFPLFLLIHILLDGIMKCEHRPFAPFSKWNYWGFVPYGTKTEWMISIIILVIILFF